jgi:hypothetical protein
LRMWKDLRSEAARWRPMPLSVEGWLQEGEVRHEGWLRPAMEAWGGPMPALDC